MNSTKPQPSKIVPYLPIWMKEGNTLLRYETRPFTQGIHSANVTYAIFETKKGKIQEETAYVKWTCNNCGFHT